MAGAYQDTRLGLKFDLCYEEEGKSKEEQRHGRGRCGRRRGTKMRKVNDVKSARDSLFAEYLHS